jgi:hypothetical protein
MTATRFASPDWSSRARFSSPDNTWARKPASWDGDDHGDFAHVTWPQVVSCIATGHGKPAFGRLIAINGTEAILQICLDCGQATGQRGSRPHRDHPNRDTYPVIRDNRLCPDRLYETPPCERCGAEGANELHHWAPRHLFDDADGWPTSYLCKGCHVEWHRVTRTGAFWRHRQEDAAA